MEIWDEFFFHLKFISNLLQICCKKKGEKSFHKFKYLRKILKWNTICLRIRCKIVIYLIFTLFYIFFIELECSVSTSFSVFIWVCFRVKRHCKTPDMDLLPLWNLWLNSNFIQYFFNFWDGHFSISNSVWEGFWDKISFVSKQSISKSIAKLWFI